MGIQIGASPPDKNEPFHPVHRSHEWYSSVNCLIRNDDCEMICHLRSGRERLLEGR